MSVDWKFNTNNSTYDLWGLSTDEKPIENVPNATLFFEMDTGKWFAFNKDDSEWLPLN